jgi:5'-nucleotidase
MDRVARRSADIVGELCEAGLPEGWLMNMNVPELDEQDPPVAYTRQSPVFPGGRLSRTDGTRGRVHYWLDADVHAVEAPQDTDVAALARGCISVTPLARDLTDHALLGDLGQRTDGGS